MRRFPTPCLMLVTEPGERLYDVVLEAVAGGINVVQWRDKTTPPALLEMQAALMRSAATKPAQLIVNGSVELSSLAHADGVHLPETALSVSELRSMLGTNMLVGRSVHSLQEAILAEQDSADYLVAGTIFASKSHPNIAPSGIGFLQDVCSAVSIPVIAIGGITPQRVKACLEAGASGVAVLSPIMRAEDPRAVAAEYWRNLCN